MLIILYQDGCDEIAARSASDLSTAFAEHIEVQLISAGAASSWPKEASWDDLLVIVYNGSGFPAAASRFIEEFVRQRPGTAMLLPVAADPAFRRPPEAVAAIKSLQYDATAPGPNGRLVNRAGGMLGLRLQGRDAKVFISYRSMDGASIANQLYAFLRESGHRAYLDEAKEIDGDTAILPGSPVQVEIDRALAEANLVLLIDTPETPASRWIKHEVDTADGLLLPILPICFRSVGDPKRGPRFPSLLALQRWIELRNPSPADDPPLTEDELSQVVSAAEEYLCEIFKRRCRVPSIVEKQFVSRGFAWRVLDKRLLIYESSKRHGPRLHTKVCSHCSIFDQIYTPALKRFYAFLRSTDRANFSLFIYDGDLLPPHQLEELLRGQDEPVIILHHQELAALIDSNFTILGGV